MPPTAMAVDKENAGPGRPATFSSTELQLLVGNCLKLASENKITVQNTWGLPLIENLPNLIKEEGGHTNFQRASVTLDAGVKIYSTRVDSVHTETFKILGTMGRAGGGAEGEEAEEEGAGEGEGSGNGAGPKRRRRAILELNEAATLEANMDALTLKKFDLAFAVDPLFKKTSAQFDEGGAKGLLLNNLSVYSGCDIVFDSMDVPETAVDTAQDQPSMLVSLAAVQGKLDAVLWTAGQEQRISPTLDEILRLLGQAPPEGAAAAADEFVRRLAASAGNVRPTPSASLMQTSTISVEGMEGPEEGCGAEEEQGYMAHAPGAADPGLADLGDYDDEYGDCGDDDGRGFDACGGFDDCFSDNEGQESVTQQQQTFSAAKGGRQSLGGDALQWLVSAGTLNMMGKGWAGGSHWRYRALPQQGAAGGEEEGGKKKRAATRKKNDPLDFVALLAQPEQPTFDKLPAKPKRAPQGGKPGGAKSAKPVALLPEDHHYQPEALARYALRPRQAVRGHSGEGAGQAAQRGTQLDFEDELRGGFSDGDDDGPADVGGGWGEVDFGGGAGGEGGQAGQEAALVVRRVEKVEVNYSKAAKQVDVRALKETLWEGIHQLLPRCQPEGVVLSFQDVLSMVQEHNPAGQLEDLSVHLCFICVLHLANEHGLVIKGTPQLNRLDISNVPAA